VNSVSGDFMSRHSSTTYFSLSTCLSVTVQCSCLYLNVSTAGTETTEPQIPDNTVMHDGRMGSRLAFQLSLRAHVIAYSVLINVSNTAVVDKR
jgi:hypothetical protein